MTPAEIAGFTMLIFRLRMDALRIVADRMPNAPIKQLIDEAEKILQWAGQSEGNL